MFRFLNKIIHDNPLKKTLNSSGGQVAIILILVIASALIFYAASINLGRYSQTKALVTVASNTSAAMLGSSMASYARMLSETNLRGGREYCKSTNVLAAIIALIIVIVATYLGQPGKGFALAMAIMAITLAALSLAMQITIIQPGITRAWNSMVNELLDTPNKFTENSIQNAMGKMITDQVMVPDLSDSDNDRIWVARADHENPPFVDEVSRYGAYYTARLHGIPAPPVVNLQAFLEALRKFLYVSTSCTDAVPCPLECTDCSATDTGTYPTWGIHDPVGPGGCASAECQECCVPPDERPAECSTAYCFGVNPCPGACSDCTTDNGETYPAPGSWVGQCGSESPYGLRYPWVYDNYYENPENNLTSPAYLSFREKIGHDDEHQQFYKDLPGTLPSWNPNNIPQNAHLLADEGFHLQDTNGFYVPPVYVPTIPPDVPENRTGIHSFFYKMADWGVDLDLSVLTTNDPANPECHWCDVRDMNCVACAISPPNLYPHPPEIPQLALSLDPLNLADGLIYNTTYFVDGLGNPVDTGANPPLAVDRVTLPVNIIAEDPASPVCAQDVLPGEGFWKRGGDRFCADPDNDPEGNTTWPYAGGCPKHGGGACTFGPSAIPVDCECGEVPGDTALFPDDAVDDLVYGLANFITLAEEWLVFEEGDPTRVRASKFQAMYPMLAQWIEPDATAGLPCFLCGNLFDPPHQDIGHLWVYLNKMTDMRFRIQGWLDNYNDATGVNDGYAGAACTEVWCVTPGPNVDCLEVPEDEYATFDGNANGVQGDVEDIVGCLDYNVEGYDYAAGEAFRACLNNCNPVNCNVGVTLPLFHLDGVTPYFYPPPAGPPPLDCIPGGAGEDWYDAMRLNLAQAVNPNGTGSGNDVRFTNCSDTCSLADCFSLPRSLVPPAIYDPKAYAAANPALEGDWLDITAFDNCLNNCNAANCEVGPRLPVAYDYTGLPLFDEAVDCLPVNWTVGNLWYDRIVAHKTSVTPLDEVDLAAFLNCFDNCSAADCTFVSAGGTLPDARTSDGVAYSVPGAPIDEVTDCQPLNWVPGNAWYDAIVINVISAGGPRCDLAAGGWLDQTRQSAIEATNQVTKFQKRRDFLDGRVNEAKAIIAILDEAIDEFDTFLNDYAAALIALRQSLVVADLEGRPYQFIYGWQDAEPDPGLGRGKWHIVKSEARIPGRCDTACGGALAPGGPQTLGSDPQWPSIGTDTHNLGTKRCYFIQNERGVVKFRATRYDEDAPSGLMVFPNGVPIWQARYSNPNRPQDAYNATELSGACTAGMIRTLPGPNPDGVADQTTAYQGAFIMNQITGGNAACWQLATQLLSTGVVSETCAEYYWGPAGMDFKFVDCVEPF